MYSYFPLRLDTSLATLCLKIMNRWALSTNHKDIGTLYLMFRLSFRLVRSALSAIVRLELNTQGHSTMDGHGYNVIVTGHGLIMIFFFVMPFPDWSCRCRAIKICVYRSEGCPRTAYFFLGAIGGGSVTISGPTGNFGFLAPLI